MSDSFVFLVLIFVAGYFLSKKKSATDSNFSTIEAFTVKNNTLLSVNTSTLAYKNNNPGNLKYAGQKGAVGSDNRGFAVFDTVNSGFEALRNQIKLDASRGKSIRQFIYGYSEDNQSSYLSFVLSKFNNNYSSDSRLSDIINNNDLNVLVDSMATFEGYYKPIEIGV